MRASCNRYIEMDHFKKLIDTGVNVNQSNQVSANTVAAIKVQKRYSTTKNISILFSILVDVYIWICLYSAKPMINLIVYRASTMKLSTEIVV